MRINELCKVMAFIKCVLRKNHRWLVTVSFFIIMPNSKESVKWVCDIAN